MDKRIAVVTGGSSGIGKACAEALAKNGYEVYELSRSGKSSAGITHVYADVCDAETLNTAFDAVPEPDLLLCCAGMGISGAVEFTETDEAKRLFNVNFFGMAETVRAAIPKMRKKGGKIIIISSVAAEYSIPFQVYYSASKAAINNFAAGLANELRAFGIGVCALMPGDIKTGFTDARQKLHLGDDVYGGSISRSVAVMENDEKNGKSPDTIAKEVLRLAKKKKLSPIYTAGADYRLLTFLKRVFPAAFANRIIGKLYVK